MLPTLVANAPTGVPRLETVSARSSRSSLRRSGNGAEQRGAGRTVTGAADVRAPRASRGARRWQGRHGRHRATVGPPNALIAAQAALVLIVLAGAALLVRSAHQSAGGADRIRYVGCAQRAGCAAGRAVRQPAQARTAFVTILDRLSAAPGRRSRCARLAAATARGRRFEWSCPRGSRRSTCRASSTADRTS